MAEKPLYDELNRAWKTTSRVLFGEEIGELKDYEGWLRGYFRPVTKRRSHLSGKEVTMALDQYEGDGARFVSFDEVKENAMDPLTINEIKDVDSIVSAVSEKWEYTGNKVLGNSAFLESCDIAMDSQYVMEGVNVQKLSHGFAVSNITVGKYIFGSTLIADGEFMVKFARGTNNKRCFESTFTYSSSDCYFSHNCHGSHDMLFSFNQWNKRNCIGNLQLSPDKYLPLKKKLIAEIAGELKKNKRFPSIFEMVPNERIGEEVRTKIAVPPGKRDGNVAPIEKSFASVARILFKKDIVPLDEYEGWLSQRIVPIKEYDTPFGNKTYLPQYERLQLSLGLPEKRFTTYEEAIELGKLHIDEEDAGDLAKIKEWIERTGCFVAEFFGGMNTNVMKSTIVVNSSNVYKSAGSIGSEYTGIDSWAMSSKHVFGCHWVTDSQFSMNCYNSYKLNRCFEVDVSNNCSDAYFCHNSEALTDAMFCFNAKGKRYAIGNAQLPPDQYRKVKDTLIGQMADELIKNKKLKWDIFNIAMAK